MKWIKSNERLPEIEGNYFVKVSGFEKENDNAEYTCGAYHHFVNTFQGKYFSSLPEHEKVIQWLDESDQLPSGVPSDDEIDQLARTASNIKQDLVIDDEERYYKNFQTYDGVVFGLKTMRDRLAPMIAKLEEALTRCKSEAENLKTRDIDESTNYGLDTIIDIVDKYKHDKL